MTFEALRRCILRYGRFRYYWAALTMHQLVIWYACKDRVYDGEGCNWPV